MIKRRDFIVAGISAGGTAAVMHTLYQAPPTIAPTAKPTQTSELVIKSGLGPQMDEFLLSLENTDKLGRQWLASLEKAPTLKQLGEQVMAKLGNATSDLAGATNTQIKRDFDDQSLCIIDGWHLSDTECKLAGLRVMAIDANPDNAAIIAAQEKAKLNASLQEGEIAPLKNWGPKKTQQGEKFNVQPDGHSGMWFQIAGAPARAKIMIDGELVRTTIKKDTVTSGLFGDMQERILSTPGSYEIALVDPIKKIKQPIGKLKVVKNPSYQDNLKGNGTSAACAVTKWGPKKTKVGVAKNEQPDGSMGVWVHIDCLPKQAKLFFGDDPLHITPKTFGFTTSIPLPLIEAPGSTPLTLRINGGASEIRIGDIVIEE
ncbi:hypothetical protein [Gilvimarinus sp. DA14]|uniref:hypothetical protein n=1 Tax=Gilvimarinus sp. DA14 TaxID=2956798 RepID=UPI0020B8399A|nr:hypothetical protein [Gilvimarinus sp. DA14]UTF59705.1 hypothetical protein NHM04_14710 [Gilvimarinus sp. DA14]